ncbi:hypothetical protein [Microbacterium sp. SYP-A9085]|uniref:hypothetical protein n=1 Tax=Microbacterium sp. SYP-A9085 TaxID=2664454 RepID=UPI0034642DDB
MEQLEGDRNLDGGFMLRAAERPVGGRDKRRPDPLSASGRLVNLLPEGRERGAQLPSVHKTLREELVEPFIDRGSILKVMRHR